jgi:hypothetical protein
MRDLYNRVDAAASLHPAARSASANGTGVDLQGYEACEVVVEFGAWTDGTHTPKIQESDDNTTFTDVAAADQLGSFTAVSSAAGQNAVQRVGYRGSKRYLRVVMTVAGATTGALSAAQVLRGCKRHRGTLV